jgi:predicted enzyme related to lactoylglutathione lyase
MGSPNVTAVLLAKDLTRVAEFYTRALGMRSIVQDEQHSQLLCHGFELVVHQIPEAMADEITIEQPPQRRIGTAIRLNIPVASIAASRATARSLGGGIDDAPPAWAERNANFFLGYDPEGNVFGVRQQAE